MYKMYVRACFKANKERGHKNTHGTLSAVNKHHKNVLELLKALKMAKMGKVEKSAKNG